MALVFANFQRKYIAKGGYRTGYVDITLDTNGPDFAVTAANLSLATLHNLQVPSSKDGFMLEWDHVAGTINCLFFDYDAVADGAAIAITGAEMNGKVIRCYYEGW